MVKNKCVYMLKNTRSEVIYVGVSSSHKKRTSEHKLDKVWKDEIDSIFISEYMHENLAYIYEIYYISKLNPKYNTQYNSGGKNYMPLLDELKFVKYDSSDILNTELRLITNDMIKDLTFTECKLLLFFLNNKSQEGYFIINNRYPSINEIYNNTGMGMTAVKNSLKQLESLGYIKRNRKRGLTIKILIDLQPIS